jgi:hypothetical protein
MSERRELGVMVRLPPRAGGTLTGAPGVVSAWILGDGWIVHR